MLVNCLYDLEQACKITENKPFYDMRTKFGAWEFGTGTATLPTGVCAWILIFSP